MTKGEGRRTKDEGQRTNDGGRGSNFRRPTSNFPPRFSPEAKHALILGAVALLVSCVPYLAGYAAQTPDRVFSGAVFDLYDYHTHLGEMQLGLRGEWLHRVLSTSEGHDGTLMRTFFIALGHVARLSGLSLPLVYQVARVLFGALFLVAVYRFIAALQPGASVRRTAFALVAFSSGLGWLVQIVAPAGPTDISPIDFWLIDANSFFSILIFPHFTAAMALLLEVFTRLLNSLRTNGPADDSTHVPILPYFITIAVYSLLLTSIHPYAVAIIIGPAIAFGVFQSIRRQAPPRRFWQLTAAVLIGAAPVLIYSAVVFVSEPVFKQWAEQNVTLSPPPIYYVLGFGLVLAFAAIGLRRFVRERGERAWLVVTWIVLIAVMVYLPVGIQRRFSEGVHVPLSLIAAYGLTALGERLSTRARFVAVNFALALAAMSNAYMVLSQTAQAALRDVALFHPGDLIAAIDWLGRHSEWTDTALAAESTGSLIPARIGHRVVLGHWAETVAYADRQQDVAAFFNASTPDADRVELLNRLGVRFVVQGDAERVLGGFDPARVDYLEQAYDSREVMVYRVQLP